MQTTVFDLQSDAILHCQFELLEALRRLDNGDRYQPERINVRILMICYCLIVTNMSLRMEYQLQRISFTTQRPTTYH